MSSELIKKHLEDIKSQKKFDDGFIDALTNANRINESGDITAGKIIEIVKQRYVENKKDKT